MYTLIHFSNIGITTKNSGSFIKLPPIVQGGDDAMKYLILNRLDQLLLSSLLSMLLAIVFRFAVMHFVWMAKPSIFFQNEQNEKVQNCEELH